MTHEKERINALSVCVHMRMARYITLIMADDKTEERKSFFQGSFGLIWRFSRT
jgi:hypothetical protein